MPYLGQLPIFDHRFGEYSIFSVRLSHFFKINSITDASDKSAILITHLSDDTYRFLRNLLYPKDIAELEYDQLIQLFDKHFAQKKATFGAKAKFYSATKQHGESLTEWAARLRGLAIRCEFGDALETVLRDRFVLGLDVGPERDKLYEQDAVTLTFDKALEIARQVSSARSENSSEYAQGFEWKAPWGNNVSRPHVQGFGSTGQPAIQCASFPAQGSATFGNAGNSLYSTQSKPRVSLFGTSSSTGAGFGNTTGLAFGNSAGPAFGNTASTAPVNLTTGPPLDKPINTSFDNNFASGFESKKV